MVSRRGHEHGAYGHYIGGTIARDTFPDRIVIYQDTLERDFGHDPALLRAQVERTVRHEVAHHLGWDGPGVRGPGFESGNEIERQERGTVLAPFDELADCRALAEARHAHCRRERLGRVFLWDHVAYRAPVRAVADP